MIKTKRSLAIVAASTAVLIAGGILVADMYVAPNVSTGGQSARGGIFNVGQALIGRATDGRSTAHVGAVPIYAVSFAPVPDDCTANGVVDLDDYDIFEECLRGPENGIIPGCICADLDDDQDADLEDASQLMRMFSDG